MSNDKRRAVREQAANSYETVAKVFQEEFRNAIDNADVEKAHSTWCLVAEMWLYLAQDLGGGQEPCIDKFMRKGVPRRGQAMPMKTGPLVPDLDQGADNGMLGCSNNLLEICASTRELMRIVTTTLGNPLRRIDEMPQFTMMKEAWQRLIDSAIKEHAYHQDDEKPETKGTLHTPPVHYAKENSEPSAPLSVSCEEPSLDDEYVLPQMDDKLLKLLAAGLTDGRLDGGKSCIELKTQLQLIYEEAKRLTAVQHRRGRTRRRQAMRTTLNNPQNGHTAFFAALRAEQFRPTSVMKTDKGLTANLPTILG